jgi:hypothetical protein
MGKRGPRKKPGERYPSGDLKPAITPAAWGRIQQSPRLFGPLLASELGRKYLHRELTGDQAEAGFYVGCIYRLSHPSALEEMHEVHPVWLASIHELQAKLHVSTHQAQAEWLAISGPDGLLSEYPSDVHKAVIELCAFNRVVNSMLYSDIRRVLDRVPLLWSDAQRRQAYDALKLAYTMGRRRPEASVQAPKQVEAKRRPDHDAHVEAMKKVIAALRPDLNADAMACLIDEFVTLRDREEFRREKLLRKQGVDTRQQS